MNGSTRLSYYNYTIEVKNLHIYFCCLVLFYISMLTFCIHLFTYLYIYNIYLFEDLFIYSFIYLFIF